MIPDEYISLLSPYLLPRSMWAPPVDEIVEFIKKYKLNESQKFVAEYLLQLYIAVYDSDKIQLVHQIASIIYSYAHSSKGYEYEILSTLLGTVSTIAFEIEKTIPRDSQIQPIPRLIDPTKPNPADLSITVVADLGKTANLVNSSAKAAISQIISSLRLIVPYRLNQIEPSDGNVDFPSEILKIPQLFLRKKRKLFRFPGAAQSSEPISTYNLKPNEEFTWTTVEKRRKFSERVDTSSVIDSVSTESEQSFETELKNTNSLKTSAETENSAYVNTRTHEQWGVDASVTAGSALTPVSAEVEANYEQSTDTDVKNEVRERASTDNYTEAVSTALAKQSQKVNTARTTALETKITVQEEEEHTDTKIRKIHNPNQDRELRVEIFQTVVPWTVYIVLSKMDFVISNGVKAVEVQFSETIKLIKSLRDPVVSVAEKSVYEIIIEALSELELFDYEQTPVKLFTLTDSVEYQGKTYPRIKLNLPTKNVAEDDENEAVNLVRGLILSKETYFMRSENTFEKTTLLEDNLASPTKTAEIQEQIAKLRAEVEKMHFENTERALVNDFIKSLSGNFGKLDRSAQIAAIMVLLNKGIGNMFDKMTLLSMIDNSDKSMTLLKED